ncbi:MAG TPA: hypothetical protein PKY35_13845 [Candidatus Hydrogenedentes bacterium]|nr:hypothetical protein [Candidatus Hydrogenedentota bacterium]HPO86469.1 hypothetical protein [Candidatus Hydrogenedentota bacterium]
MPDNGELSGEMPVTYNFGIPRIQFLHATPPLSLRGVPPGTTWQSPPDLGHNNVPSL